MTDVATRVARGAAWLDGKYPGWWRAVDLSTLEMADCNLCVLGQVYSGHIPAGERNQLVAQVARAFQWSGVNLDTQIEHVHRHWGGYSILNSAYDLLDDGRPLGFLAKRSLEDDLDDIEQDYQDLLEEWTRFIIQRRLDEHPDVASLSSLGSITDEIFRTYAEAA